ncbi:hypothetical protein BdWA1_000088 [Babesia duncani]|uniref:Uncharacterized protein n=1 Tax=Babesia duncani TaxID=323732 RepID=A0AAD9PM46_9APIC|nr:hypothetical protein BdWA1_000088 [Babesia duncani]
MKSMKPIKSINSFYCNPRVNILLRLKSYSRRIRLRAKWYNEINYKPSLLTKNPAVTIDKLQNDTVDYIQVAKLLGEELLSKITFLSNNDAVYIFDIISRISKPLTRLAMVQDKRDAENKNDGSDAIEHYSAFKSVDLSKMLKNIQKCLLQHILGDGINNCISKRDRYYLICTLSRDCSLISIQQWRHLFDHVEHALTSQECIYAPFEIANILLVYSQINKWILKRESTKSTIALDRSNNNAITVPNSDIDIFIANSNGGIRKDVIYNGLQRLVPNICKLKFNKIVKLLYLQSSRKIYNSSFCIEALKLLNGSGIIHHMPLGDLVTCIKQYYKGYLFHLNSELECMGMMMQFLHKIESTTNLTSGIFNNSDSSIANNFNWINKSRALELKTLMQQTEVFSLGLVYLLCFYTMHCTCFGNCKLDTSAICEYIKSIESHVFSPILPELLKAIYNSNINLIENAPLSSEKGVMPSIHHVIDIAKIIISCILFNGRIATHLVTENDLHVTIQYRNLFMMNCLVKCLRSIIGTGGLLLGNESKFGDLSELMKQQIQMISNANLVEATRNVNQVDRNLVNSTCMDLSKASETSYAIMNETLNLLKITQ